MNENRHQLNKVPQPRIAEHESKAIDNRIVEFLATNASMRKMAWREKRAIVFECAACRAYWKIKSGHHRWVFGMAQAMQARRKRRRCGILFLQNAAESGAEVNGYWWFQISRRTHTGRAGWFKPESRCQCCRNGRLEYRNGSSICFTLHLICLPNAQQIGRSWAHRSQICLIRRWW